VARELCGVNKGTHNPPFGQFYHDPVRGDLTGLMCAAAVHISLQKIRENETVKDLIETL